MMPMAAPLDEGSRRRARRLQSAWFFIFANSAHLKPSSSSSFPFTKDVLIIKRIDAASRVGDDATPGRDEAADENLSQRNEGSEGSREKTFACAWDLIRDARVLEQSAKRLLNRKTKWKEMFHFLWPRRILRLLDKTRYFTWEAHLHFNNYLSSPPSSQVRLRRRCFIDCNKFLCVSRLPAISMYEDQLQQALIFHSSSHSFDGDIRKGEVCHFKMSHLLCHYF